MTPLHVGAGAWAATLLGPVASGLILSICFFIYQYYDSLPKVCSDWEHTKWDVIEFGIGAGVTATIIEFFPGVIPCVKAVF